MLLLDEPFSALDALSRMRLQEALVTIHAARPCTTLLVTHDIDEAIYTSDRIVVMAHRPGRIIDDIAVPPGHPRDRADPQLLALKARVLRDLVNPTTSLPTIGALATPPTIERSLSPW